MIRLDQALVDRGLVESREKASRAILAGKVRVNGQLAAKPGNRIRESDAVVLEAPEKYVSRGGEKMEHALKFFQLDLHGKSAVDLGASTGGFTDCLLQHGVSHVHAVDVGQGQLAWKLRNDPRVTVMEKTNARYLTRADLKDLGEGADVVVIDCSFISLRKILPVAAGISHAKGVIVALIKPQFEAGRAEVDKGAGVILDPAIHQRVLTELREFVTGELGLVWKNETQSPLIGPAGNKEFLVLIEKKHQDH